jgi:type II secretory ATPase GspE/PulE/Tfp pilus assembly ATPase PilB-like protein
MLDKILRAAVERGASDVHVKAGDVIRATYDRLGSVSVRFV